MNEVEGTKSFPPPSFPNGRKFELLHKIKVLFCETIKNNTFHDNTGIPVVYTDMFQKPISVCFRCWEK